MLRLRLSLTEGQKERDVADYKGPVPQPTPETKPYWEGLRQGKLMIQRCKKCHKAYFYPRPVCPHCHSWEIEWFQASGKGKLYSYNINYRPPPYMGTAPTVIAMVELEEGPRLMSNLIEVEPDPGKIKCDAPVELAFKKLTEEIMLPQFRLAKR